MDSVKEFRNMFLKCYLEKNKIGRRSISRSISKTKSKPIASSMNTSGLCLNAESVNKLSKSFDAKMLSTKSTNEEEPDDEDDDIYKYFDFKCKKSDTNRGSQRYSLPNPVNELETFDEMIARQNNTQNQSSSLSFLNEASLSSQFQHLASPSHAELYGSQTNSAAYSLNLINNNEESFFTNLDCLNFSLTNPTPIYFSESGKWIYIFVFF